ncbi:hypothetical protein [Kitasatospora sp. MAP5-34]|uniref:hypothetical protein n=1 Tax=Kitasatospora sp. MAP5-34 TaxID=3035102 RepID=UPI002476E6C9|nr:hypothetical protein [Kitasatospora sp. MAP5-34]MDH6574485.1 hypothetical protein [Kitasatospora sp. MAP5-34]
MSEHDPLPGVPEGAGRPPELPGDAAPGTGPADSGTSIDLLAAALRRDSADLEVYAQVLTGALAEALPPGAVALERRRSMSDRLAGRAGKVEKLEVSLDDRRLVLTLAHGRPAGEIATVVRGVVLSRKPVPLDEWAMALASSLAERARSDARAREALEKLLLGG